MDQVEQYGPPPNPAKETDARYGAYRDRFGDECWELDALEPQVISDLILTEFNKLVDADKWKEAKTEEEEAKASLDALVENWDGVVEYLNTIN
jgi:hypothetical protein